MTGKRKFSTILAVIAVLILVYFIVSAVTSITGDPITAAIATSDIKSYVQGNYPDKDFEISHASYNFKFSHYSSLVKSRISRDTYFHVSWRKGKIYDDYEYEVANGFNIYERLQKELEEVIEKILTEEFPYKVSLMIAEISIGEDAMKKLVLDMDLDIHHPPRQTELTLWMVDPDISTEGLMDRLMEIHGLMVKHDIPMDVYSLRIMKNEEKPSEEDNHLYDFPAEKITDEGLKDAVIEHKRLMDENDAKQKDSEVTGQKEKIEQLRQE